MSDKTISFSGTFQEFYEQAYEQGVMQGYEAAIEILERTQEDAENDIPTEDLVYDDQVRRDEVYNTILVLKMYEKNLKESISDGEFKNFIPEVGLINLLPPEEKTTDN